MQISFQKTPGDPTLGLLFCWRLEINHRQPEPIRDLIIPELFYDFFYLEQGEVRLRDGEAAPRQCLKTLHTRPLTFFYTPPLVLYGARLGLGFAEAYWEERLPANSFVEAGWVSRLPGDLEGFAIQVQAAILSRRSPKHPYPMLTPAGKESGWLASYSPRHKRRLYKETFGLSRKEMQAIRNVHAFLEQTCDFEIDMPRIISHVNPDVFYDQPHLNRAFKKVTGLAPVEYFAAGSLLQDQLMSASYNANPVEEDKI